MRRTMKAARGHAPKRHKVFPVPVKLKKPKLKPLPLVMVKKDGEIGCVIGETPDPNIVVVFLQSRKKKKFHRYELERIKIKREVKKNVPQETE